MSFHQQRLAQALRNPDLAEILERRCVRDVDGCLLWQGPLFKGYGKYNSIAVHKLWYMFHNGEVPKGMVLAHSCHKKHCLIHARPQTQAFNIRESSQLKTRCVRGHLYDEKNTRYGSKGERICRECSRTYWNRRLACDQLN